LLNDILESSKVDAGKITLGPRRLYLDRLPRDLSVILSAHVGNKDIEVLCDIDPALPRSLPGDDMHLQQVLIRPRCCSTPRPTCASRRPTPNS